MTDEREAVARIIAEHIREVEGERDELRVRALALEALLKEALAHLQGVLADHKIGRGSSVARAEAYAFLLTIKDAPWPDWRTASPDKAIEHD